MLTQKHRLKGLPDFNVQWPILDTFFHKKSCVNKVNILFYSLLTQFNSYAQKARFPIIGYSELFFIVEVKNFSTSFMII